MASVWKATDRILSRAVAVKVLHPHLAEDPGYLERFRAEGRSAARLSHAAVVAIYDTVSEPGCEAIVMELVEGETLRSLLDAHGPLPFPEAVAVVDQVAAALEAAHDAGIVHRDIKPGNILLCADRRVKITDFGIATSATGGDPTAGGVLMGTAKYLAPEQVEGRAVDGRTDLYSLGIVLYEALTGTVPFEGDTPAATAAARLERDPPPLASRRAGVPPGLAAVVTVALARDPADRFPSASALRASLATATMPPPPPVDPTVVLGPHGVDPARVATAPADPARVAAAAADPAARRAQEPVVVGGSGALRAVVVGAVVAGSLLLGMALFAATTLGRDLYQRALSAVSDTVTGDGGPTVVPPSPAGAAEDTADDAAPAQGTDAEAPAGSVLIASVSDFDPEGDGTEHRDRAPLAADGAPGTFWHSERYDTREFGNLKSGVGLVVALDGTRPVNRLEVTSPTRGWAGRVFVSDGAAADLGGWGQPVDGRVDVDGTVRFDLRGVVGSHLLLWFTDLGDELPRPRVEVSELDVS